MADVQITFIRLQGTQKIELQYHSYTTVMKNAIYKLVSTRSINLHADINVALQTFALHVNDKIRLILIPVSEIWAVELSEV